MGIKKYKTIGFLGNGKKREDSTDDLRLAVDRMKNYKKSKVVSKDTGHTMFKRGF